MVLGRLDAMVSGLMLTLPSKWTALLRLSDVEINAAASVVVNARRKWVQQNIATTDWVVQPTRI